MANFKIRTIAGGTGGLFIGGALLTFQIQQILKEGANLSQYYRFIGIGSAVGIPAGGYGPSQWTDFAADCSINDFHGYAILSAAQGGPVGMSKLSFISGPAKGTEIIGYGWGVSSDASISFIHGWMKIS